MGKKLTTEYVRGKVEDRGWTFDDDEYLCNNVPFNYTCDKGHKGSMQWLSFQHGRGCRQCVNRNIKYTIKYIRTQFDGRGYLLKTTVYVNNKTKLDYTCPNGHEGSITWSDFKKGHGCPKCSNSVSKQEKELQTFLTENSVEFISNTRGILVNPLTKGRLELDLWFPNINKAIEFNGEYWHSLPGAHERDKIKQDLCKEKDIDLMVVMYKDWMNDPDKCKEQIIDFVKYTKESI